MAYDEEQRRTAIETFVRFDRSYADTIAELGYPNRGTLRAWWREYERTGEVPARTPVSERRYPLEVRRRAVEHCLSHGRRLSRTMRALGYPKSREVLARWVDELAPGQRRLLAPAERRGPVPAGARARAVAELEARAGTAAEVAERNGVSRHALYAWRREILGHNGGDAKGEAKGGPVSEEAKTGKARGAGAETDGLPDDLESLQTMLRDAKARLRRVQLGLDVRQATLEMLKKARAPTRAA